MDEVLPGGTASFRPDLRRGCGVTADNLGLDAQGGVWRAQENNGVLSKRASAEDCL